MSRPSSRRWLAVGVALFVVGAGLRLHNARVYDLDMGFDAPQNWEYVELLVRDRAIPHPEAGWSTGHPPFFYLLAAGLRVLAGGDKEATVLRTRLASSALGLAVVAWMALLLHRRERERPRRVALAVGLVLALPVHVMMSAMFGEEMLTASLVSLALLGVSHDLGARAVHGSADERSTMLRACGWGALAGLAWLTKLTGVLALVAGTLAYVFAVQRRKVRPGAALGFAATGGLVGGWFYLRNLVLYGYLYPYGLPANRVMFSMPPGERGPVDYLWVPLAAFRDPDPLAPELLHSVWGTTYASIWFDPHRHFLPLEAPGLVALSVVLLVLGLVPTLAFLHGLARRLVQAARSRLGPADLVWPVYTLLVLIGYVAFTLRNPWFVTVKGSFLLSLAVPYALWASDGLDRLWERGPAVLRVALASALAVLWVGAHVGFTYEGWFDKRELPGRTWQAVTPR